MGRGLQLKGILIRMVTFYSFMAQTKDHFFCSTVATRTGPESPSADKNLFFYCLRKIPTFSRHIWVTAGLHDGESMDSWSF